MGRTTICRICMRTERFFRDRVLWISGVSVIDSPYTALLHISIDNQEQAC